MRILIPIVGSRGDVQPMVAAGLELQRRGHTVLVGAPPNFVDFVANTGLAVRQFGPDVNALYSSPEGQRVLAAGNSAKMLAMVSRQMREYADQMDDELIDIASGTEMIVSITFSEDRSVSLAEALDVPMVTLQTYPSSKNSCYAPPSSLPHHWPTPRFVNRGLWTVADKLRTLLFRKYINNLRAKLDLPPTKASTEAALIKRGVPEVQIYDPALVPGLAEEWGAARPFAGFLWFPRSAREAIGELAVQHAEVLQWIADGEPPIFFGFGSMPILDFGSVIGLIEQICERRGQRALVGVDGAHVDMQALKTGPNVKVVDNMAHDLIFPHCRAAVHHGGVGTLFESARAGVPTLVCSVSMDQPFWGHQVEQLGIGAHIPFPKLRADTLSRGIDIVLDDQTRSRAEALAVTIRERGDGVPRVCDIVEKVAAG
ncbi:nucleotide disphospho-sugar-binding domain-containing protein [Mycolicibacterium sphagni]|uniref:Glycosyltransferase family 1 protein n=1 Tax=Mycolicibacterium sphagni TaxID=1786 RepID=A0ABX2JW08_9MYCO|nr:glycosyltransferase family 1 protein [Mycolicibacterium sphagni]